MVNRARVERRLEGWAVCASISHLSFPYIFFFSNYHGNYRNSLVSGLTSRGSSEWYATELSRSGRCWK